MKVRVVWLVLAFGPIACAALRSFGFADGKVTDRHEWPVGRLGSVVSFGEDSQGELYICTSSGRVYRIIKTPGNPAP